MPEIESSIVVEAKEPDAETLLVVNDISLDEQVEGLIRNHKELNITRHRSDKLALSSGPDPAGLKILPISSRQRLEGWYRRVQGLS